MTTTPDYARLIERLEKVEPDTPGEGVTRYYRNPDGPGAATALRTLLERNAALERERDTARRHTGNLLARIHRDGGHYEGEHGTSKAVEDADLIISEMLVRAEAAEARLAEAMRVIEPFAKAGELFPNVSPGEIEYDQCVYLPAAGDEYALKGSHLRAARALKENGNAK